MRLSFRIVPTILLLGCGSQPLTSAPPVPFPLPDGVTLIDASSGASVPTATLLTRLASADFVLLEEDPTTVAPERIKDVKVVETWLDGRRRYAA